MQTLKKDNKKIKILLACSAGMSTSLLEDSMKNYMGEKGIDGKVEAHGSEMAKKLVKDFDVILLGPQVRFMLPTFVELANGKYVDIISPSDYALSRGDNVVNKILEKI